MRILALAGSQGWRAPWPPPWRDAMSFSKFHIKKLIAGMRHGLRPCPGVTTDAKCHIIGLLSIMTKLPSAVLFSPQAQPKCTSPRPLPTPYLSCSLLPSAGWPSSSLPLQLPYSCGLGTPSAYVEVHFTLLNRVPWSWVAYKDGGLFSHNPGDWEVQACQGWLSGKCSVF